MAYSPGVEKLLIEKHGFTKMDDGTVVSPQGTFKDDSGSYVKYTPPAATPDPLPMQTMNVAPPTFSTGTPFPPQAPAGIPGALPPEPTQTMDDLTSALDTAQDLDIGAGTRYKNRESDLTGVKCV